MTPISPTAADIIGLAGSLLFIAGFAYANIAKELNQLWFNAVNLVGAVMLLISLSVHFNLAAFVLEAAWGAIAAMGLVRAVWVRFNKPSPHLGRGLGEGPERSEASVAPSTTGLPLSPALSPEGERGL